MMSPFAAIVGGAGGAIVMLGILSLCVWICIRQRRKFSNKNSETGSSDPSAIEMKRGETSQFSGPSEKLQFKMEELEQATRNFNESNIIGCGTFGLVFKGLLNDGTVVAIKRRNGDPRQEFREEVAYLSTILHRNLVTLLGYCQERGYQMLVFEYLPNGSMCSHLYDTGKDPITKLEFKQRLSIAVGTAKGLCHLHGLIPPLVHGNFKTANVLVDENFIAKVADSGLLKILENVEYASSSGSSSSYNAFRDPELGQFSVLHEMNDVYSFGVFLLELISGKEAATYIEAFRSNDSMIHWVKEHLSLNDLVDHRLVGTFTAEGMRDFISLMLKCVRFPGKERPKMENVVMDIEKIHDEEIQRTTFMGEGIAIVTLGSQLFTN